MSSKLKQAAQQALKELGEARKIIRASSSRQLAKDWDRRATAVLADLRTAIQQAESEPVAGPTTYQQRFTEVVSLLCRAAPPSDMVEGWLTPDADDHRLQEWAIEYAPNWSQGIGVLDAAHVMADQPAEGEGHETRNTYPAPGVPDDSKRLDYLQDRGATIDLIPGVADFYPMQFRVGGLHSSANTDVRAAIDAAMLAASQAQKT